MRAGSTSIYVLLLLSICLAGTNRGFYASVDAAPVAQNDANGPQPVADQQAPGVVQPNDSAPAKAPESKGEKFKHTIKTIIPEPLRDFVMPEDAATGLNANKTTEEIRKEAFKEKVIPFVLATGAGTLAGIGVDAATTAAISASTLGVGTVAGVVAGGAAGGATSTILYNKLYKHGNWVARHREILKEKAKADSLDPTKGSDVAAEKQRLYTEAEAKQEQLEAEINADKELSTAEKAKELGILATAGAVGGAVGAVIGPIAGDLAGSVSGNLLQNAAVAGAVNKATETVASSTTEKAAHTVTEEGLKELS